MLRRSPFVRLLRNPDFRRLWLAQGVSGMGNWLALIALMSLGGFRLRLSAGELGGMAALFFLSLALVFPLAGALVDRANPRRVMIAANGFRASLMFLLGIAWEWSLIYPVLVLSGWTMCFSLSAQVAVTPSLVDREELMTANAASLQTQQMNGILAPLLAGSLIARVGERACFALNGLSFLFAAFCLSGLGAPQAPPRERRSRSFRELLRDLQSASCVLLRDRPLVCVLSLAMGLILATSSVNVLGVVYLRDVLGGGPRDFGMLLSSLAVGTVVGIGLVGTYARAVSRLALIQISSASIGLGLIGFTFLTNLVEVLIGAFLMGIAAAAFLISAQTLIHERTPPHFLGRLSGLAWSLLLVTQAIALTIAASLATVWELPTLYRVLGTGLLSLTAGLSFWQRRSR